MEPQFIICKGGILSLPQASVCQDSGKLLSSLPGALALEPSHFEEQRPLSRVPVMAKLQHKLHIAWCSMLGGGRSTDPGLGRHQVVERQSFPSFSLSRPPSLLRSWLSHGVCSLYYLWSLQSQSPEDFASPASSYCPPSLLAPTNVYPCLLCAYVIE